MAITKKFTALDGFDATGSLTKDDKNATIVIVSNTAPSNPVEGNLWYDSETGKTYMYYTDGDSNQWIETGVI